MLAVPLTASKLISNLVEYLYFVAFNKFKKYQQFVFKYVFLTGDAQFRWEGLHTEREEGGDLSLLMDDSPS